MANRHGGYRRPTNPAPVSGPGALSRRTDGTQPQMKIPDAQYGEQQDFQAIQAGAPMAGTPSPPATPFGAPTERPDEPVTSGIDLGAGVGSDALGMVDPQAIQEKADTDQLYSYLPVLEFLANRPGSSQSLKNVVRSLKASR